MLASTQDIASRRQIRSTEMRTLSVIQHVLDEFCLDKDAAQRLHESGGHFSKQLTQKFAHLIRDLSSSDEYAEEKVEVDENDHLYLTPTVSTTKQLSVLYYHFSFLKELKPTVLIDRKPIFAERWFAIPRWEVIGDTYPGAVVNVLEVINKTRMIVSGIDISRVSDTLGKKKALMNLWTSQQKNDIVMVPVQLGKLHAGMSARRSRAIFLGNEFGLGAYEVLMILLLNPDRFRHHRDLQIICPGDGISGEKIEYEDVPIILLEKSETLKLLSCNLKALGPMAGSATGFLPLD